MPLKFAGTNSHLMSDPESEIMVYVFPTVLATSRVNGTASREVLCYIAKKAELKKGLVHEKGWDKNSHETRILDFTNIFW